MRRGASESSRRDDPLGNGERKRGFSAAIRKMTRRNSTRSSRTVSDSSNESDYERIKQVKWTAGALSQLPDTMANEIFSLAARLNTMWGNKSAGSRSSGMSSRSRQSSEESDWGADYSGSGVGAGVTMWGKSKRSLMGLGESTASRRALFKSQSSFGSSFASFRDIDLGESDENDAASSPEPRRTSATSWASKGSTTFRRSSKRKQSRTAKLKAKANSFIKAAYLNTSTKSVASVPDVVLLKPDATIHSLPKTVFRKIWEFVGPLHHWSFEEAHKEQQRLGFLHPGAQWILMSADIPIETVFGVPDGVPPKTASEEIEAKLCANTAVGHLYFHWAKIYGDHGAMLGRVLTQNSAIHSLSVWLDGEASSFEALIAGLEHNVGLKALDLTGSAAAVGASGNSLLHELLSLKNLEHLNLHSCQLSAPSLMSLSRGIRESKSLVSLNLSQNKNMSKPVGEKVFAAIAESGSLRSLNVSDCKLGEDAGVALATLARYHATLEAIDMSYNPGICTPFVSEALVKTISKSRHLKSLKMGGIFWPEMSVSAFALAVGESISIEEFFCEGDCGFESFKPALLKTRVLKRLALGGNMTLHSALALCDALKVNNSLRVLRIRELELGEEFGEALIDVLRVNSSLRKIDARKNGCSNLIPQMDADELARCKF